MRLRDFLQRPDLLFLLIAAPVGLVLCFLIPPLGGGNETHNFPRVAGIAYGQPLVGSSEVPAGIGDFIAQGSGFFHGGLQLPFSYTRAEYSTMAAIPLRADATAALQPDPIAVHHPFTYLPQAVALRLMAAFGASPLVLFTLTRLVGFASALMLTFLAIRIMPSHRYALAALALLPPIVYSRSTVDADPLTNAVAFLFIACALRAMVGSGVLQARRLVGLAVLAFVAAQCKSAYFVLPFVALAVPAARFGSRPGYRAWMAVLILPGVLGSLGWMLLVKQSMFAAGVAYTTWSGEADPDAQMRLILRHPFDYAGVLFDKLFLTSFFPRVAVEVFGLFGPPVLLAPAVVLTLIALFVLAVLADPTKGAAYPARLRWLAPLIAAAFLVLALTLLYVQWTGLGKDTIDGFQGRYLFPLLPLLLVLVRATPRRLVGVADCALLLPGIVGSAAMLWKTVWAYYG
ncbi:MAG TPA: DUF2142 domain-containing protein [Dongiaceae bacterium]|nr:DUF2142 domain-containing protein [Dongiaceae bacterium]